MLLSCWSEVDKRKIMSSSLSRWECFRILGLESSASQGKIVDCPLRRHPMCVPIELRFTVRMLCVLQNLIELKRETFQAGSNVQRNQLKQFLFYITVY